MKASSLKKKIVTHRTVPNDPELNEKRETLKHEQKQNHLAQKYIKGLTQKVRAMESNKKYVSHQNNLKKLDKDVAKLEKHKKKLLERLYSQWKDLTALNPESELKSKMVKTAEKIVEHKKASLKAQEDLKAVQNSTKKIHNEYAKLSKKKKVLINKKIALKNNIPQKEFDKKSFALQEEHDALKSKHEKLKQMMINKEIKQIDKILAKEK